MDRAKQKVYPYWRSICWEIIRNKNFSNCIHSCFIHKVSFGFEHTSYILNWQCQCTILTKSLLVFRSWNICSNDLRYCLIMYSTMYKYLL
jgi:hypothetical protein